MILSFSFLSPTLSLGVGTHWTGCFPPAIHLFSHWSESASDIWSRSRASCAAALHPGVRTLLRDPRLPSASWGRKSGGWLWCSRPGDSRHSADLKTAEALRASWHCRDLKKMSRKMEKPFQALGVPLKEKRGRTSVFGDTTAEASSSPDLRICSPPPHRHCSGPKKPTPPADLTRSLCAGWAQT